MDNEILNIKRPLHCIVGGGNLGMDIASTLKSKNSSIMILTKRLGFGYPMRPYGLEEITERMPDVIWLATGAGSVGGDFLHQLDIHVRLVVETLKEAAPGAKVVAFSTDYVADPANIQDPTKRIREPQSSYARSKVWMEEFIVDSNDPRIRAVRVGSLYGEWKPRSCFPSKLCANSYRSQEPVVLPINQVCPTPTKWLAKILVENLDAIFAEPYPITHLAPSGHLSVADWGRLILGNGRVIDGDLDPKRPAFSSIGCPFLADAPHCTELWQEYGTDVVLGRSMARL
jgi:dTDP-4-dehydrorhamnose reductase